MGISDSNPREGAPMPPDGRSRLTFVDHLRTSLVMLVVLHHVALVYGAGAPFYYMEPPLNDPLAFLILLVFVLVNQSWFMGALFLLSGYLTPASLERKGTGRFLRDRIIRLGLPLLVFVFVLGPLSSVGFWQMPANLTGITAPLTWKAYPHLIDLGPMWFVALLLVFDLGYAGWRKLTRDRPARSRGRSTPPGLIGMVVFALALAAVSFALRIGIPLDREVFGFPTLAYLPQYASFFALGALASRRDWLRTLPRSWGVLGFAAALVVWVVLFPLAFSGRMFSLEMTPALAHPWGRGTWQSAVYALWDSVFAVGMCLGVLVLFRRFFDRAGRLGRLLSRHSYAVYVLHSPIIVFLALALRGIGFAALPKFALASVIMVPACYITAWLVRRIPGVSKVV